MNNITEILMQHEAQTMDTCRLDPLMTMGSSTITASTIGALETDYYLYQIVSFCVATVLAVTSMAYSYVRRFLPQKPRGFRFHLIGVGRPKHMSASQFKLLDNINTEDTLISIQTELTSSSPISLLKEEIKKTYDIPENRDILIIFSHHLVSFDDDTLTLKHFTIADNALLTVAVCDSEKAVICENLSEKRVFITYPPVDPNDIVEEAEPEPEIREDSPEPLHDPAEVNALFGMCQSDDDDVSSSDSESDEPNEPLFMTSTQPVRNVNRLFDMFEEDSSDEDMPESSPEPTPTPTPPPVTYPRLGFDVIMQEDDVLVHQMPGCECEMNHDSLYHYALSTFSDSANLDLTCPHPKYPQSRRCSKLCGHKWNYAEIYDILRYEDPAENTTKMSKQQREKREHERWVRCAKLELLASRNLIEKELNVQKCPGCSTLYYRNPRADGAKQLEDIKTKQDIEDEFRFACLFCEPNVTKTVEEIPFTEQELKDMEKEDLNRPRTITAHDEDEIEEDIDGAQVNAMFGAESDDEDDDDEPRYVRRGEHDPQVLNQVFEMFEDDKYWEKVTHTHEHEFCFCCGQTWTTEHVCDSSFKADLVQILQMAETKKIGQVSDVPSVRCCPSCCQLIFHVEACKHMACRGCRKDFCFVCLKPKDERGNWQCGSHCDACPVAPRQQEKDLPDTIVLTKKSFKLYD